jgi:hypothetical protein
MALGETLEKAFVSLQIRVRPVRLVLFARLTFSCQYYHGNAAHGEFLLTKT